MRYRFYTTSHAAWVGMNKAVSAAQKSIYLESFILVDDEITHYFFENLKQKAKEGVKVKIIADFVGNFGLNAVDEKAFKAAGIEVLTFSRWFYRNHRKTLIVDEEIAFLGGVNIRGRYANWLDIHLRLSGRVVDSMLHSFARVYRLAGGKDEELLGYERKKFKKVAVRLYESKIWFINHWPFKGKSALKNYYTKKCTNAKKSITIVTPYFIPHRWLTRLLRRAIKNGVKIEVLLPDKTDSWLTTIANHVFARELGRDIQFFFIPEMTHAKVLLVDDSEGLIGSNNIDAQSFDFNLETSVVFRHEGMIADLRSIIERWKETASPVRAISQARSWLYYPLVICIKLLQPIL